MQHMPCGCNPSHLFVLNKAATCQFPIWFAQIGPLAPFQFPASITYSHYLSRQQQQVNHATLLNYFITSQLPAPRISIFSIFFSWIILAFLLTHVANESQFVTFCDRLGCGSFYLINQIKCFNLECFWFINFIGVHVDGDSKISHRVMFVSCKI